MGWFWAGKVASNKNNSNDIEDSLCPVMHYNNTSTGGRGKINPLNYIPRNLSSTDKQPGQRLSLTTNKTLSSIPRGATTSNNNGTTEGTPDDKWQYPSAQQMYNAMVRRGKIHSNDPSLQEDTVEAMVQIHNFLNESCWYEILRWEKPHTERSHLEPKLLKFMGKPGLLTPRARLHHYLSFLFPWYLQRDLPFDRHDWIVLRGVPSDNNNTTTTAAAAAEPKYTQIRYVLDFYSGPDDPNGMPTFSVDVRPALDNFTNVKDRFHHFTSSILSKFFNYRE